MIVIVIIVLIVVMYNQHKNYIKDKNRIKELEQRLNEYYIERGKRLNTNIKRIETNHNRIRNNGVHSV